MKKIVFLFVCLLVSGNLLGKIKNVKVCTVNAKGKKSWHWECVPLDAHKYADGSESSNMGDLWMPINNQHVCFKHVKVQCSYKRVCKWIGGTRYLVWECKNLRLGVPAESPKIVRDEHGWLKVRTDNGQLTDPALDIVLKSPKHPSTPCWVEGEVKTINSLSSYSEICVHVVRKSPSGFYCHRTELYDIGKLRKKDDRWFLPFWRGKKVLMVEVKWNPELTVFEIPHRENGINSRHLFIAGNLELNGLIEGGEWQDDHDEYENPSFAEKMKVMTVSGHFVRGKYFRYDDKPSWNGYYGVNRNRALRLRGGDEKATTISPDLLPEYVEEVWDRLTKGARGTVLPVSFEQMRGWHGLVSLWYQSKDGSEVGVWSRCGGKFILNRKVKGEEEEVTYSPRKAEDCYVLLDKLHSQGVHYNKLRSDFGDEFVAAWEGRSLPPELRTSGEQQLPSPSAPPASLLVEADDDDDEEPSSPPASPLENNNDSVPVEPPAHNDSPASLPVNDRPSPSNDAIANDETAFVQPKHDYRLLGAAGGCFALATVLAVCAGVQQRKVGRVSRMLYEHMQNFSAVDREALHKLIHEQRSKQRGVYGSLFTSALAVVAGCVAAHRGWRGVSDQVSGEQ